MNLSMCLGSTRAESNPSQNSRLSWAPWVPEAIHKRMTVCSSMGSMFKGFIFEGALRYRMTSMTGTLSGALGAARSF